MHGDQQDNRLDHQHPLLCQADLKIQASNVDVEAINRPLDLQSLTGLFTSTNTSHRPISKKVVVMQQRNRTSQRTRMRCDNHHYHRRILNARRGGGLHSTRKFARAARLLHALDQWHARAPLLIRTEVGRHSGCIFEGWLLEERSDFFGAALQ